MDRVVGSAAVLLLPISALGIHGFSVGLGLGSFISIVSAPKVTLYRRANVVVALAIAALASRPLLSSLATADGSRTIDSAASNRTMLLMLYVLVGLVTLLWYREKFGDRRTALLFGLGSLAQALLDRNAWQGDPWKFALAWPVAIVVLAGTGKKLELHALAALLVLASLRFSKFRWALLFGLDNMLLAPLAQQEPCPNLSTLLGCVIGDSNFGPDRHLRRSGWDIGRRNSGENCCADARR